MQSSLDAYLEHLRSERQVSTHTLDGYRRDLLKVLALCEKHEVASWDALDTRTLIGQAQGILMERFDLDADQSFAVLRRYSQESNRRIGEIVGEIVATRQLPETIESIATVDRPAL